MGNKEVIEQPPDVGDEPRAGDDTDVQPTAVALDREVDPKSVGQHRQDNEAADAATDELEGLALAGHVGHDDVEGQARVVGDPRPVGGMEEAGVSLLRPSEGAVSSPGLALAEREAAVARTGTAKRVRSSSRLGLIVRRAFARATSRSRVSGSGSWVGSGHVGSISAGVDPVSHSIGRREIQLGPATGATK